MVFRSLARPEVLCNLCCLGVASVGEEKIRFSILSNAGHGVLIVLLHDSRTYDKRRGENHGDPRLQVSLYCSILQVIHLSGVHAYLISVVLAYSGFSGTADSL